MPRKDSRPPRERNVPWITKNGYLDLTEFPIDSVLRQALSDDRLAFGSACRILASMAHVGRSEAVVFLCGLLVHYRDDMAKKREVVEALGYVKSRQAAQLLFAELDQTESSNSTRTYINGILKALEGYPLEAVQNGFEALLSSAKWSCKMKRKFRESLAEIEYRNRQRTRPSS